MTGLSGSLDRVLLAGTDLERLSKRVDVGSPFTWQTVWESRREFFHSLLRRI